MSLRRTSVAIVLGALVTGVSGSHAKSQATLRPLVVAARDQVGAEIVQSRYGLTGEGTTLCLIDTGVDPGHPTFRDARGETRIRWWMEIGSSPRGRWSELELVGPGAVWRGDELDDHHRDRHGHGTAMASIALGDDSEGRQEGPYAGFAPEAGLIVVDAYDESVAGFEDADVLTGIDFCIRAARFDDSISEQTLVILLALGTHVGPHDSMSAFERGIEIRAQEVPIVVAAGNDGGRPVRAGGYLLSGEETTVDLVLPRSDRNEGEVVLFLRSDSPPTLSSPSGLPLELDPFTDVRIDDLGDAYAIHLRGRGGPLPSGAYPLSVRGEGRFELWLARVRLGSTLLPPRLSGPTVRSDELVSIPATVISAIAVGASGLDHPVSLATGAQLSPTGTNGEAASYTSIGPSADGAPKPDLVAPGGWLRAALSRTLRPGDEENIVSGAPARYRTDPDHIAVRGSSASAAVVAGALLLALEYEPNPRAPFRQLLIASARGESSWSPDVGWGELDLPRLLMAFGGARSLVENSVGFTRAPRADDGPIWVTGRLEDTRVATVELQLAAHTFVVPVVAGTYELRFEGGRWRAGETAFSRVRVNGEIVASSSEIVVRDRGAWGELLAGGGCRSRVLPSRSRSRIDVLIFFLLVVISVARRRSTM